MLTLDQLRAAVDDGSIDTVLVAFTDMRGRLQGKRCAAPYFLTEVVPHAADPCNHQREIAFRYADALTTCDNQERRRGFERL